MEERKIRLFNGVPEEAINNLLDNKYNSRRTYKKGEYITTQGSSCRALYILTDGSANAVMTNAEGKELAIERLTAPELLAPAFVFGDENRFPVTLVATDDCQVCIIGKASLLQFMHTYPTVMESFISEISNRCVFLSRKLNEFALQNLRYRVMNYLQVHHAIRNQQEVSLRLGVARPSLARVLAEMLKEGLIAKTGNCIVLSAEIHRQTKG